MGYSAYGIVRPIYVTKSDSPSSISNTFLPFSKRLNWLNREDAYATMSRCKDKCMFTLNACGDAFPIERVLVATYLLSVEALPHCRCGVANKGCMV